MTFTCSVELHPWWTWDAIQKFKLFHKIRCQKCNNQLTAFPQLTLKLCRKTNIYVSYAAILRVCNIIQQSLTKCCFTVSSLFGLYVCGNCLDSVGPQCGTDWFYISVWVRQPWDVPFVKSLWSLVNCHVFVCLNSCWIPASWTNPIMFVEPLVFSTASAGRNYHTKNIQT